LAKCDDRAVVSLCPSALTVGQYYFVEQTWVNIPALPVFADDSDALLVVPRERADDLGLAWWTKPDLLSNVKIQHLYMRAHFPQKAETSYDAVVQLDQFFFRQAVNANPVIAVPLGDTHT